MSSSNIASHPAGLLLFTIVGLLFFGDGLQRFYHGMSLINNGTAAEVSVSTEKEGTGKGSHYYLNLSFQDEAGESHDVHMSVNRATWQAAEEHDTIAIRYDPDNPEDLVLDDKFPVMWEYLPVMAMGFFVMALCGGKLLMLLRRDDKAI